MKEHQLVGYMVQDRAGISELAVYRPVYRCEHARLSTTTHNLPSSVPPRGAGPVPHALRATAVRCVPTGLSNP